MSTSTDLVQATKCPLCGKELHPVPARNALSRIDNATYICSQCGQAEALSIRMPEAGKPRECLYFDEVGGIMLVTENEPGYFPLFPAPAADAGWCRNYVDQANEKLDYSIEDRNDIVASSMFGAWS